MNCMLLGNDDAWVTESTRAGLHADDDLAAFLDACCIVQEHARVGKTELYANYERWCRESGRPAASKKKLGQQLMERGFQDGRTERQRYWIGLKLAGSDENDGQLEAARKLLACLRRNDALAEIRLEMSLRLNNRGTRKRLLSIAASRSFMKAWESSVQAAIAPIIRAAWQAWQRQRGTERERLRRLRQIVHTVDQLRDYFPAEMV
ncbi:MAG: primase-like DNA-binding domain-containing protein [Phycisphaeraceae bacterium]